ncbi:ribosome small subunit-dependent GTPase A [Pseudooceanicola algae]|uniref:Small ribosomal subunit biogenesis GTPase RsgA n=1 Tax=Pseudooceanicola algae TaxID=1537215 RepID=A0A418SIG9_9RHOB|nr:ribosome small subunit-dependent GTPase A [Pseudooceanicola algae]QPM91129.1 Small ribosomal subunit biogenesis GTPase RsgA [Pseudooceanicola algae]
MTSYTLADLGWSDHFADQIAADNTDIPARITDIHRARIIALGAGAEHLSLPLSGRTGLAIGDWILHDHDRITRSLDPTGVIQRAAPHTLLPQIIAANVDTLGIVTSCNADFNPARIERYLAMAMAAEALPLVILTKPDLADDPDSYRRQTEAISPLLVAITLNAKDPEDALRLAPWCGPGRTLALTGSSGVGKTTLRNALTGEADRTAGIREDDAKGRHTTTARALRPTITGGWLIDTPGMRELGMSGTSEGIDAVFSDIGDLLGTCRFSDCAHVSEPGCAILGAVAAGQIDPARLDRWRKLQAEEAHSQASTSAARDLAKKREKMYNSGRKRGRQKRGQSED